MMETADGPSVWTGDETVDAVLDALAETVPEVRRQLAERRSYVDRENPTGDRVSEADDFADVRLRERLLEVDGVAAYASEERDGVVTPEGNAYDPDGRSYDTDGNSFDADGNAYKGDAGGYAAETGEPYHLAVDPLDGSSNLRSNNPMGTILGVYNRPLPTAGRHLVASAVVLYGPNTTMLVTDGDTATEYLLTGDGRQLLDDDYRLPDDPGVYGVGGRRPDWTAPVAEAVDSLEADRLSLRYGGALVADVNQVLTHGGLFAYPELRDRPEGKLRYLFECAPVGLLATAAGGRVSNGERDLLSVEPDELHARTPFYVGNPSLVDEFERAIAARD